MLYESLKLTFEISMKYIQLDRQTHHKIIKFRKTFIYALLKHKNIIFGQLNFLISYLCFINLKNIKYAQIHFVMFLKVYNHFLCHEIIMLTIKITILSSYLN